MASNIINSQMVVDESLRVLHNKLNFIGRINRQYDKRFAQSGAKIGTQLQIKLPIQPIVRTGLTIQTQNIQETSETLTLATVRGVDLIFDSIDLTMKINDFSKQFIQPQVAVLASVIEADAFNMFKDVYQLVGSPGASPSAYITFLNAQTKLNQSLTPYDEERNIIVPSGVMATSVDALKGFFTPTNEIGRYIKQGYINRDLAGFEWWRNEMTPVFTNGLNGGSPVINGANQTGSALITNGWTANTTVNQGTVFTIGSGTAVNFIHPETKSSYGVAQQFVVTANCTADAYGNIAVLPISPAIIPMTSYPSGTQGGPGTVTASPDNGASISISTGTASTSYQQSLCFHKDAFTFVSADMDIPNGMEMSARSMYEGISMAFIRGFDIVNRQYISRIDVLYGYKTIRPPLACRITS
jgi:hypothetical protein